MTKSRQLSIGQVWEDATVGHNMFHQRAEVQVIHWEGRLEGYIVDFIVYTCGHRQSFLLDSCRLYEFCLRFPNFIGYFNEVTADS